jgi:23S rRNA (pseudouridine1915-N3)-methyltransferase
MPITVIAVGHKLPRWAQEATDEYLKRLPADWAVELKALRAVDPETAPLERVLQLEAERIAAAVPARAKLIVLDERGKDWTSATLAGQLRRWRDEGDSPCFVIGGANGIAPELKARAQLLLRLSSLTLPHALARVLLAEQIYRAWSLLAAHPYHRA